MDAFFLVLFCNMNLADNIKAIRESKGFKQIEVADHIGVDKSAYSKIEKGSRALTVDELQKMATLFDLTTDQIINYDGAILVEITIEDKSAVEQIRLIQQLDDDDKQTIFKLIDKMLTNKKFKDFFKSNVAAL
jgi:transcriptional regulator with XRE-family HTH domain